MFLAYTEKTFLVHCLPGRSRFAVPGLQGNKNFLAWLTKRLANLPGVLAVRGSAFSGTILIMFDISLLNATQLSDYVDSSQKQYYMESKRPESIRGKIALKKEKAPNFYPEPEDLPFLRQLFNVVLGGVTLSFLGLKRLRSIPAPAMSPWLYNLGIVTATITGYPILRSGLVNFFSKRQINFDLIISVLSLGALLLRESIPGLLIVWLVNFNSLVQSLLLASSRRLTGVAPVPGEISSLTSHQPALNGFYGALQNTLPPEQVCPASLYNKRNLLALASLLAISGLLARDFNRCLAILLGASPAPAGLARPGVLCAGLASARRSGILISRPASLFSLSKVDNLLLINGWGLRARVKISGIYTFNQNLPREMTALIYLALKQGQHELIKLFSFKDATWEETNIEAGKLAVRVHSKMANNEEILIGGAGFMREKGISTAPGLFRARKITAMGEIPLFAARNGSLAAILGIKGQLTRETSIALNKFKSKGIKVVTLARDQEPFFTLARDAGIEVKSIQDGEKILGNPSPQGKITALAGGEREPDLAAKAGLVIVSGLIPFPCQDMIILNGANIKKVERLFSLGHAVSERERQNISLVSSLSVLGAFLGVSGRLAPLPASLYNNLISFLVLLNSYRLILPSLNNFYFSPNTRTHPEYNEQNIKNAGPQPAKKILPALDEMPFQLEKYTFKRSHMSEALPKKDVKPTSSGPAWAATPEWARLEAEETLQILNTSEKRGLSRKKAKELLARYGQNQLAVAPPPGFLARMLKQFKGFLVQTLLGSSLVCLFLGEIADSLAIMSILFFNALLGALQEHRAESALQALKEMTVPLARVKRNGRWQSIPSFLLVPGDIIMLEIGDGIPADARLLKAFSLEVTESALTGESFPVVKDERPVQGCISLIDCSNIVFMGTSVTRGRARAVVVATGMQSELGKIAGLLKEKQAAPTNLQQNIAVVGKNVLITSLAVSGLLFFVGIIRKESPLTMFLTALSLAVAAIPEGLPAIVTVALAAGVHRMAREKALVRTLPAVENIGGVTVICTDKTGTLTKNEQTVRIIACSDGGYWQQNKIGGFIPLNNKGDEGVLLFLLTAGILAGNASLEPVSTWEKGRAAGNPLEGAILLAGEKAGLDLSELIRDYTRIIENPFNSERRRMSAVYRQRNPAGLISFVKGAPEVVLKLCTDYFSSTGRHLLDEQARGYFTRANLKLAGSALRVLAIAYRPLNEYEGKDKALPAENNLTLLGLIGMHDPPRLEVCEVIKKCRRAGVKVVMITGDHSKTALAVGKELGLVQTDLEIITGSELENLNDEQLPEVIKKIRIFARVLPAHKLRLVKAFRTLGERVVMIGDGVNDAPAVKEADVGVAMGITGTQVTRESSDIILADDNFATVVAAIEQGRGIYSNIQTSVRYLLATNMGEIILVLLSMFGGLPLPLLPIQLLWLNLLGDSFPALALSLNPPEQSLMNRPPRDPKGFFDRNYLAALISRGLSIGLTSLGAYLWGLKDNNLLRARTIALSSLTSSQLLHALDCRQGHKDKKLTGGAVALSGGLLLAAIYLPPARAIFKTASLGPADWLAVLVSSGMSNLLDSIATPILNASPPAFASSSSRDEAEI